MNAKSVSVGKVKWSVDELTRLAFICGESDRRAMAEADRGEYGKEQGRLADAMLAYRLKRWGRTTAEADIDACTHVVEIHPEGFGEVRRRRIKP